MTDQTAQVTVSDVAHSVRSKNAGPFWVTIDVFCGNDAAYQKIVHGLQTQQVADSLRQPIAAVKRFDIESLNVIKLSIPRPVVQGHMHDRDQHGAQWAVLIAQLPLTGLPGCC